jgi:large subunit ribosomal protein L21
MHAILVSGGKQYRVEPGDRLIVERLQAEPGAEVEFDQVLLVANGANVQVGHPTVPGAKVKAHVLEHDRGEKLIVFKYKAKVRYRRKTGHRQERTHLRVTDITGVTSGTQEGRRQQPQRQRQSRAATGS